MIGLAASRLTEKYHFPDGNVIIEGKDIVEVAPALSQEDGLYVVRFKLSSEAAKAFSAATARLIGQPISIWLDDEEISAPRVSERISGGEGNISFAGHHPDHGLLGNAAVVKVLAHASDAVAAHLALGTVLVEYAHARVRALA